MIKFLQVMFHLHILMRTFNEFNIGFNNHFTESLVLRRTRFKRSKIRNPHHSNFSQLPPPLTSREISLWAELSNSDECSYDNLQIAAREKGRSYTHVETGWDLARRERESLTNRKSKWLPEEEDEKRKETKSKGKIHRADARAVA